MLLQIPDSDALQRWLGSFDLLGIDGLGLVLILAFALLGAWRGLWWQILRLVALVVATWAASTLTPNLAARMVSDTAEIDPRLLRGFVWIGLFFLALGLFALLGRVGQRLLRAMQLAAWDRVGGAAAGALTGLLLHAALVASITHLGTPTYAEETLLGTRSGKLYTVLSERVPLLLANRQSFDFNWNELSPEESMSESTSNDEAGELERPSLVR